MELDIIALKTQTISDHNGAAVSMASSRRLPMATMAQKQQQRTPRSTPVEDGALSEGSPSVAGDSDSGMSQAMSELSLAGSQTREVAKLAIVSLNLEPYIERQRSDSLATLGRQSEKERDMRLAAALGYATHVTHHLANYLGVPLKYPLRPANSRSAVLEGQVPVGSMREGRSTEEDAGDGLSQNEYLLYPDGSEQARFSHAIFLLNKDIEQLLESHGLTSAGPSLVLQNLYKLLSAALSAVKT